MHTFSPGCSALVAASVASLLRVRFDAAAGAAIGVVVVDVRRALGAVGGQDILAAVIIKFALRTVPVSARSACL
jgi:hypothetical protein